MAKKVKEQEIHLIKKETLKLIEEKVKELREKMPIEESEKYGSKYATQKLLREVLDVTKAGREGTEADIQREILDICAICVRILNGEFDGDPNTKPENM